MLKPFFGETIAAYLLERQVDGIELGVVAGAKLKATE